MTAPTNFRTLPATFRTLPSTAMTLKSSTFILTIYDKEVWGLGGVSGVGAWVGVLGFRGEGFEARGSRGFGERGTVLVFFVLVFLLGGRGGGGGLGLGVLGVCCSLGFKVLGAEGVVIVECFRWGTP